MVILTIVIAILIAERAWTEMGWRKERGELVRAIVARNAAELATLTRVANGMPKPDRPASRPYPEVPIGMTGE